MYMNEQRDHRKSKLDGARSYVSEWVQIPSKAKNLEFSRKVEAYGGKAYASLQHLVKGYGKAAPM